MSNRPSGVICYGESLERRLFLSASIYPFQLFSTPGISYTSASGDFNLDGNLDLAVISNTTSASPPNTTISILLGKGDGTFGQASNTAFACQTGGLVSGDFNGDGLVDLVAGLTTSGAGSSLLIGRGDGTFAPPIRISGNNGTIVAADFNTDGKLDLAINSSSGPAVLLSNGAGTFGTPTTLATPATPSKLLSVDFNGDGASDLAVTNYNSSSANGSVTLFRGLGNGSFAAGSSYAVGMQPAAVVSGDFNKDGKTDLVVSNTTVTNSNYGTLTELLNQGNGAFTAGATVNVNPLAVGINTLDYNGDGNLDILTNNAYGFVGSIVYGNGNGAFAAPVSTGRTSTNFAILGDWNNDGRADIAYTLTSQVNASGVVISLARPNGTFAAPLARSTRPLALVDVNADGKLDSIHTNGVQLGDAAGNFVTTAYLSTTYSTFQVVTADFNGDGKLDIVTPGVYVYLGTGDGTFAFSNSYAPSGYQSDVVASGDFNGDGKPDLAAGYLYGGTIDILLNKGDGTFSAGVSLSSGPTESFIVSSDLDGDGNVDLVINSNGAIKLFKGNGRGGFAAARTLATASSTDTALTSGDFDDDGRVDLITNSLKLLSNGDGTFRVSATTATTGYLRVADLNSDGLPDLFSSTGSLLLNDGVGNFPSLLQYDATFTSAGDVNSDGRIDLAGSGFFLNEKKNAFAGVSSSTLNVSGAGAGAVTLSVRNGSVIVSTATDVDGFSLGSVSQLLLNGSSGNDTFNINSTLPFPVTIKGNGGADALNVNAGTITFPYDLGTGNSGMSVNVSQAASVVFGSSQHLTALAVNGNASLSSNGNWSLTVGNINIGTTGKLDLSNNAMLLDYNEASPSATLANLLKTGRNGGTWNGSSGIVSSAIAGVANSSLGYAEASSILGPTGGTFAGQVVDGTALLVRFTLLGDTNLDRKVDIVDLGNLSSNWQRSSSNWAQGDFNYDNLVDVVDLGNLSSDWQQTYTPPAPASAAPGKSVTPPVIATPPKKGTVPTTTVAASLKAPVLPSLAPPAAMDFPQIARI